MGKDHQRPKNRCIPSAWRRGNGRGNGWGQRGRVWKAGTADRRAGERLSQEWAGQRGGLYRLLQLGTADRREGGELEARPTNRPAGPRALSRRRQRSLSESCSCDAMR